MKNIIGIRREDLSKTGEKRVALVPDKVVEFARQGQEFLVQPGIHPNGTEKRGFPDEAYSKAGAQISEDLSGAQVIFGLKEIERDKILPEKAYLFFSHTHKGQKKNRSMLGDLVAKKCTVIDYELITDAHNRRVVTAFTYFAGYAGLTDSLWTLGKRWEMEGVDNAFSQIPQSIELEHLQPVKDRLRQVGLRIAEEGTPAEKPPVIIAVLGNGKTSQGVQEMLAELSVEKITRDQLAETYAQGDRRKVYQLVLDIPEMYRLKAHSPYRGQVTGWQELFDLYLQEPEHFESDLEEIFPLVTVMLNCIIWSPKYPRLLTREDTREWYRGSQTLAVIGDITCDPEGAIQFSKETWIDEPVFIYDPEHMTQTDGFVGPGIAVMAVTNLPCEFSADASAAFCRDIEPLLPGIFSADYTANDPQSAGLPPEIQKAVILWQGRFTPGFEYMRDYLAG